MWEEIFEANMSTMADPVGQASNSTVAGRRLSWWSKWKDRVDAAKNALASKARELGNLKNLYTAAQRSLKTVSETARKAAQAAREATQLADQWRTAATNAVNQVRNFANDMKGQVLSIKDAAVTAWRTVNSLANYIIDELLKNFDVVARYLQSSEIVNVITRLVQADIDATINVPKEPMCADLGLNTPDFISWLHLARMPWIRRPTIPTIPNIPGMFLNTRGSFVELQHDRKTYWNRNLLVADTPNN